METRQRVTVKIKPYLQEFLRCKLADDAAEASRKTLVGAFMSPLLEYAPKDYVHRRLVGANYISFELPRGVGEGKETRRGVLVVSERNQRVFERMLKRYFDDIFYQYVEDKIRYTHKIKDTILCFCDDYHLTFDDVTYEMLKKKYYRRQKKLNNSTIFARKMSLCSPLITLLL